MSNKLKMKKPKNRTPTAIMNISNYTLQQISELTSCRVDSLMIWKNAREAEIRQAAIEEFSEKLHRAEDHAAFVNLLISMYAIKMTWGFTKSQEKFLSNLNPAQDYIRRVGIRKAFDNIMQDCGALLEFDDFEIQEEIHALEEQKRINDMKYGG